VISPRKYGNELQFANHSFTKCNVEWDDIIGLDGYIHIIFVAIKKIMCNDEILVNYGEKYWSDIRIVPNE
jgi:SET domain-containing protein